MGRFSGVERRQRWEEKARIVEETLAPGAVVSERGRTAWRRACSSPGEGWRTPEPTGKDGAILLPVESDTMVPPPLSEAARSSRPATSGRRTRPGVIEIELAESHLVPKLDHTRQPHPKILFYVPGRMITFAGRRLERCQQGAIGCAKNSCVVEQHVFVFLLAFRHDFFDPSWPMPALEA
jgi:transposase